MEYLYYSSLYYQIYNVQPYWKEYCKYGYYDYEIQCKDRKIYYSIYGELSSIYIIEEGIEYQIHIHKNRVWLSGILISGNYNFDVDNYIRFDSTTSIWPRV